MYRDCMSLDGSDSEALVNISIVIELGEAVCTLREWNR